ncbi:unnamed protein product [Dicrocoelium dendriticum]|nr:unnamed protein product [Dicrocoelium dendriticum]
MAAGLQAILAAQQVFHVRPKNPNVWCTKSHQQPKPNKHNKQQPNRPLDLGPPPPPLLPEASPGGGCNLTSGPGQLILPPCLRSEGFPTPILSPLEQESLSLRPPPPLLKSIL